MWKAAGAGFISVVIPIGVEYGAKGGRIAPNSVKWSVVAGVAEGAVGLGGALGAAKGWFARGMSEENKAALAAFGGAGLATGISIWILDYLRQQALYTFKRRAGRVPENIPLTPQGYPTMEEEAPRTALVEEI